MNIKVSNAAFVSLLALAGIVGCTTSTSEPIAAAPTLVTNGGVNEVKSHSLAGREFGVVDFGKTGLSASAYVSGNTVIFYAGGCDTFTATILSDTELSAAVINPMNTVDNASCNQESESTVKLGQHLDNVASGLGRFEVLNAQEFTLDGVLFGGAMYDWVTWPALPYNFYGDESQSEVTGTTTPESDFPKMFVAERQYGIVLTTNSLGAANTPLIYVLPNHSGLLLQVFGSAETPPEIGEVFVDTQNQLWIGVDDFVSVAVPDEMTELAPTVYKLNPFEWHWDSVSELYHFANNAFIIDGKTGNPVQATITDEMTLIQS